MMHLAPTADLSGDRFRMARPAAQLRLGYLVSQYPAVSHTFIYREIVALRKSGATILTSSVNLPDRPANQLPECERVEADGVFYIKATPALRIGAAIIRTLFSRPRGFFAGLATAFNHGFSNPSEFFRWCGYFGEAVIVGDRLRSQGFHRLHVHFATEVANVGYLTARVFGIELSITVHGPDEFYDVTRYALKKKIEAANLVCCISHYTRSQLMKLTSPDQWHKLQVARLGVDVRHFYPQEFRAKPPVFQLLCVGRLVPAKGQHILLRAIAELVSLGYNLRLRLVGDGPSRADLERYCSENDLNRTVTFEGAVNQDRIREFIGSADLFVLASFAEGVPVVLMEAMACEVACVSTIITGIPELIRNGIDGLLVPSSDEHALAEAIGGLIDDPQLRRRLGKAGRVRVTQTFEIDRNVNHLRSLLACAPGNPAA